MAKGHREQVCSKHTDYKHILTSLQRNKVMWHKVMSLASDQGQVSLLCLVGLKKKWVQKQGRKAGLRWREGRHHMLRDAAVVAEMEDRLTPTGRAASLWFAISGLFNLGDKGSAGPALNHSLSWCSIHGKQHDTSTEPRPRGCAFKQESLSRWHSPVN